MFHNSTRRCRCSTRALESLILDLAGLRLSSSTQRWASSSIAARPLSVTTGHCPSKRTFASQRFSSAKDSSRAPRDRLSSSRGEPPTKATKSAPQKKSRGDDRNGHAKKVKPTKHEAPKTIAEPGRSVEKNLSRLLRKQRRIEAGKFGTRTEPESVQTPAATPDAVSEVMRRGILEKVEAALHKVDEKNAGQTGLQRDGVALREKKSLGRSTTKTQADANAAGVVGQDIEVHEGVNEQLKAEESTDGVSESHDSVLKRIDGLSDSDGVKFKAPSLLFGMEGDMANPNQKFAKDKPLGPYKPKDKEAWQIQKAALQEKFGSVAWDPHKRLSPDSLNGIRALHASDPDTYSTEVLAENFKVSPEAIRRILKSKWRPSEDEARDRLERWERRGARKWEELAASGLRPPRRWRALGIQQRGVAETRLRRRMPKIVERKGPGGVQVHRSMEGVITQKVDQHGRVLSAAQARPARKSATGSFAGRIV